MRVAIVDYGVGNIFSLKRALEHLDAEVIISDDPDFLLKEKKIILPGVGAFEKGMFELQKRGLDKMLHESAKSGNIILGICLGMQLLMSESDEYGSHKGLNLINGKVTLLPKSNLDKVPHVGWNSILAPNDNAWNNSILSSVKNASFTYFVHSYRVVPSNEKNILAVTNYAGISYCSAIQEENIMGCQFHPELSSEVGLQILKNFLKR